MTPAAPTTEGPVSGRPLRQPLFERWRQPALGLAGLAFVVALVEVLPRVGAVDRRFLPPFSTIARSLGGALADGGFWTALGQTLRGWALGLAIAMLAGIVLGVVIGSVPLLRALTASTIEFLRPIPSVALIPLVVLIYGSQLQSALVLVVYAAFWQVLVQVLYGVADVDPVVRDTARSYRFSRWAVVRTVVWPTALPYVVTGFRLAAAVALILEITAELIIGVPGLGRSIGVAQSSGAVAETYALVIVVGVVGVLVNASARAVERRVLRWHTSVRGDL
ncbi:ABC transporter permease [Dactylosporangium sucinum]|uniref:Nitrate ABC transporter permease n=1 Tax=Dactylosporangium sucinum TaxID=1424081 RepID=A0A917U063_9ACTN|nr:ABC transporter permease [Dactylosporangium sucinum]GGM47887.1 nitrate ABC transporter permease [Dactylosporangium sucinum]